MSTLSERGKGVLSPEGAPTELVVVYGSSKPGTKTDDRPKESEKGATETSPVCTFTEGREDTDHAPRSSNPLSTPTDHSERYAGIGAPSEPEGVRYRTVPVT